MAPGHSKRPAAALSANGPRKTGRLADATSPTGIIEELKLKRGRLVDKHGHLHSEHIFQHWSPAAIRALGIRRVERDNDGGEP
jgi:hypothetical protein